MESVSHVLDFSSGALKEMGWAVFLSSKLALIASLGDPDGEEFAFLQFKQSEPAGPKCSLQPSMKPSLKHFIVCPHVGDRLEENNLISKIAETVLFHHCLSKKTSIPSYLVHLTPNIFPTPFFNSSFGPPSNHTFSPPSPSKTKIFHSQPPPPSRALTTLTLTVPLPLGPST